MSDTKLKMKIYKKGKVGTNFEIDEEIGRLFKKIINEQAAAVINESAANSDVSFPCVWSPRSDGYSGKAVKDPLTVYFTFDVADDEDDDPILKFNLREALKPTIEECAEDGSCLYGLKQLHCALVSWCSEIKKAIDAGENASMLKGIK